MIDKTTTSARIEPYRTAHRARARRIHENPESEHNLSLIDSRIPTQDENSVHENCADEAGFSMAGLSVDRARELLLQYGPNRLTMKKGKSPVAVFLSQFRSPFTYVLVAAAFVSLVVKDGVMDASIIAIVLFMNAVIGFVQEWRAERTMESIKRLIEELCMVVRDGEEVEIPSDELVPGDILFLKAGDRVPADAIVLFERNLHVDESLLTGESNPIKKESRCESEYPHYYEASNKVFAGSYVTQGRSRVLISSTGDNTALGEINRRLIDIEKEPTPLSRQVGGLSRFFLVVSFAFFAVVLVLGLAKGIDLVSLFLFSVSSLVAAIPESLLVVVTVVVSIGVYRLSRQRVIVRNLAVVETLGVTDVICSDKTGTLTKNQMTVRRIFTPEKLYEVDGSGYNADVGAVYLAGCGPAGCLRPLSLSSAGSSHEDITGPIRGDTLALFPDLKKLLSGMALCNDADLLQECTEDRGCQTDGKQSFQRQWKIKGSPTEAAILVALEKTGLRKFALDELLPRISEIPFSSQRKFMATLHERNRDGYSELLTGFAVKGNLLIVKGAPEVIEGFLSSPSGSVEAAREFASQGLRVLSCACKYVDENTWQIAETDLKEMIFLGLCGINDPPREEVASYIKRCTRAGISVLMLTGDNDLTARAIGREVGILQSEQEDSGLRGEDLDSMDEERLKEFIRRGTRVFSRISPFHKLRIVRALQTLGKTVTMTGDGVNDSPALRQADVGIAMGLTGTEIAKEAADIVLQDERFETVVQGIEEGRHIFNTLRRVVLYLLASSLGQNLLIAATLLFVANPVLLFPAQILWINLVTSGMIDMGLAMEPRESGLLDRPPRRPSEPVLARETLAVGLYYSLFMACIAFIVYIMYSGAGQAKLRTILFITLIVLQWFQALNCRSQTKSVFAIGFFRNRSLNLAILLNMLLVTAVFVIPLMSVAFDVTSLGILDFLLVASAGASIFAVDEIRKMIQRRLGSTPV